MPLEQDLSSHEIKNNDIKPGASEGSIKSEETM